MNFIISIERVSIDLILQPLEPVIIPYVCGQSVGVVPKFSAEEAVQFNLPLIFSNSKTCCKVNLLPEKPVKSTTALLSEVNEMN